MPVQACMESERLFQLLASIHPLSANFKKALDKELQFVSYPKGHSLIQSPSIASHAYYLEKGFAASYHYFDNRKIVTTFWKPGEIIVSPKSFFEQSPATDNIQLTVDAELLCISHASVMKLSETFHVANILSHRILSQYHTKSEERIIDFHYLDLWGRYQKLLKNYPRLELNVSQDFIASYLNVTAQSLSRLKHNRKNS